MMLMESLDATKLMSEQRHHAAMPTHPRIAADSGSIDANRPQGPHRVKRDRVRRRVTA
jgi:hypothetical protein